MYVTAPNDSRSTDWKHLAKKYFFPTICDAVYQHVRYVADAYYRTVRCLESGYFPFRKWVSRGCCADFYVCYKTSQTVSASLEETRRKTTVTCARRTTSLFIQNSTAKETTAEDDGRRRRRPRKRRGQTNVDQSIGSRWHERVGCASTSDLADIPGGVDADTDIDADRRWCKSAEGRFVIWSRLTRAMPSDCERISNYRFVGVKWMWYTWTNEERFLHGSRQLCGLSEAFEW